MSCNKFRVERVCAPFSGNVDGEGKGFKFVLCIAGSGEFVCGEYSCELVKGGNVFVPGNCEEAFTIEGDCECLITSE